MCLNVLSVAITEGKKIGTILGETSEHVTQKAHIG